VSARAPLLAAEAPPVHLRTPLMNAPSLTTSIRAPVSHSQSTELLFHSSTIRSSASTDSAPTLGISRVVSLLTVAFKSLADIPSETRFETRQEQVTFSRPIRSSPAASSGPQERFILMEPLLLTSKKTLMSLEIHRSHSILPIASTVLALELLVSITPFQAL